MPRLRGWVTIAIVFCLVVATGGVAGTVLWGWGYRLPISNRSDLDTTVIGVASLVLVVVGAVLALIAYREATGRPNLRCEIKFDLSDVNKPVFRVEQSPPDNRMSLARIKGPGVGQ